MAYRADEILARYEAGEKAHPNGKPIRDAAAIWLRVQRAGGAPLGEARVRDSARREWVVAPSRDPERGRVATFRPARGDNEPFRLSADGYRPAAFLPVPAEDWNVLALAAAVEGAGHADEELATAADRVADRLVKEAQHRLLMGAAEDEDDAG